MPTNETTPRISQEDWDTAETLVQEGHSADEVRELVAGNSKEIYVDNIEQPVAALGAESVRQAMKAHDEVAVMEDAFPSPYENGRRA